MKIANINNNQDKTVLFMLQDFCIIDDKSKNITAKAQGFMLSANEAQIKLIINHFEVISVPELVDFSIAFQEFQIISDAKSALISQNKNKEKNAIIAIIFIFFCL